MKKRLFSIILTVCLVMALLPTEALAAETTNTFGAFTVTYDGSGTAPTYGGNVLTLGSGTYTINGTTTADKIVVSSGATANITLNGVNIDLSGTNDACAFDMSGATVNLTLNGTNLLKSGAHRAGLRVPPGASLTITEESTGSLIATTTTPENGASGAGIGGNGGWGGLAGQACGTVTINGGTVTAIGVDAPYSCNGAGIGGGGCNVSTAINVAGAGGTVIINGGTVIAAGGLPGHASIGGGAGIGGGGGARSGSGATVIINGGSVKATGGGSGAAIGAGAAASAAGTEHGTLKNASGTDVTLYTLALSGVNTVTAVTGLSATPALDYTYGTTDMKTDTDGKLYLYLPAGKTGANVTTAAAKTYKNDSFTGNTATLYNCYAVSGTVSAGTTGADVSGLTVNLYASSDDSFSTSVGSAITDGSSVYTIYVPNGSYVARVAGVAGSYAASVSSTITVSDSGVSGANITLTALTTQSIAVKAGSQKISYLVNDSLDVTNLKITVTRSDGSTYDKDVTADMVSGFDSSAVAASLTLTVTFEGKTNTYNISVSRAAYSGAAAPAPTLISKTDTQVTLNAVTVTGQTVEYGKNTSNTIPTAWQDGTTFTGLTAGTPYYFFARVKQTDAIEAGGVSTALTVIAKEAGSAGTPAAPTIGTGADKPTSDRITINTVAGNEYYISTSSTPAATWPSSGSDYFKATGTDVHTFTGLTAGMQYYIHVRVAETDDAMPSASAYAAQYTLPVTPSESAVSINYAAETISFANTYEVSTNADFSATITSGVTLQPGMTYYVRVKATGGVPASESANFTVAARPEAPSTGAYSYDYEDEQIIFGGNYEVYTANDGTGSAVASNGTITPGDTLYVRVKSTDSAPASGWTTINVPARPETTGLSIIASRSDTTITVNAITGAQYSNDGGTTWQSSNEFNGLDADTDYDITIRYAAAGAFASDALPIVTIRTKTSAGDAPSVPSVTTQTDHTITIDTVAGCQYAVTTSSTAPTIWGAVETTTGTMTFSSLSAATRYYIWVRVAETDTAAPSDSSRISVYTAASVPSGGGYTIDYSTETISYDDSIYEVTADTVALPLIIIGDGDSITDNISDYSAAAQKIYVRIRAVADGAPAGAWAEVTLPARPETPAASASDETADNKNDGRISGVTEAMEWRAAGGTYTVVTAEQALNGITGLSDGIYYVRYMAVSGSGFKSEEQEITIASGHTITVTFHSQNGSAVDAITGKAYGDSIAAPVDPVRSGFYFAGWYRDASYTNPWTFTLDTLTEDITLFAKWSAIPTYTVTGKIVDDTSHVVEGATVRMMQGATQFGTTGVTDIHGDFVINNIPPGTYNLVITKGTKTAIIKVEVNGDVAIGSAALPSGNANSVLVVSGSATPNVVVGGLNSEAGTQLAGSSNPLADNVEVKLTVEKKDASTATKGSEVTGTVTAAGKQVGMILEIDVRKTVNGTEDPSYNQTSGLIEINIPLPAEMQGKATYAIYRYHGAAVDTITETPNGDLEKIVVDRTNWIITLYSKKFSTYAIGYTNPASSKGGGGGGTAAPGTTPAAIESQITGALPYYVENGKEIFIGFAMDEDGTMKYIVPAGVTVLFRQNSKEFSDIAGHWAKSNIDFVTQRELFLGTGDDKFSPQSGMTRAMFATVIGRLYERSYGELLKKDDNNFTDIDKDSYYAAYIDWASENNIISGIGGGLFKPDREITRQEMAAILYRFAEFLSVLPSGLEKTQLNYPDAAGISSWATEAAFYCQQTGIITGRSGGNFVPQGTATRAEVAAILQRFIENSVK